MELPFIRYNNWNSNLWEKAENRAQNSSLENDASNCFLGSHSLIELTQTQRFSDSFQDISISPVKQIGVSPSIELFSTSSFHIEDNNLVALEGKLSATSTVGALTMNKNTCVNPSIAIENFDIFDLLSEYISKGNHESDNTYSDEELVWECLPLDIPVEVKSPLIEKKNNIPKIQKKIKKVNFIAEGETVKTSRRNSDNYTYYSNAGDSQRKKNRNLPGIFRDRFINKLYYIINKEKILTTTQNELMRNYKKLAIKDAEIKYIYNELAGLSDSDFSDFMRFLQNYQQDLDEYKYFDMCRKYKGWHDIQADSSLESPNFYNYMKKVFKGRITEEDWTNYILYTPKDDILNALEHIIRSTDISNEFMFRNWKENKTWKRLRDLCTLDGYGNASFLFWRMMEHYLSESSYAQEDEVDREIFSDLFLKEFKIEVSRYCQLKYYLKQKGA